MRDEPPSQTSTPPPLPALIPPFRYATVEDGVIRGAHPTLKNYRFVRRLRLKTIVSLMPEPPTQDLVEFCGAEGIELISHSVQKYDDSEVLSISGALVADVLAVLLDPIRHPIFIHCRDGGHNTGLIIMCLRKLQHWTNEFIYDEHRRYTKLNEIHYQEMQFTEAFSGPVRLPETLPRWLWGGVRARAHPSIRIVDSYAEAIEHHERKNQHQRSQRAFLTHVQQTEQHRNHTHPSHGAPSSRPQSSRATGSAADSASEPALRARSSSSDASGSASGSFSRLKSTVSARSESLNPHLESGSSVAARIVSSTPSNSSTFSPPGGAREVSLERQGRPHSVLGHGHSSVTKSRQGPGNGGLEAVGDSQEEILWPAFSPSTSQALEYLDLAPSSELSKGERPTGSSAGKFSVK